MKQALLMAFIELLKELGVCLFHIGNTLICVLEILFQDNYGQLLFSYFCGKISSGHHPDDNTGKQHRHRRYNNCNSIHIAKITIYRYSSLLILCG